MSRSPWSERLGALSGVLGWVLFSVAVSLMDPSRGNLIPDPTSPSGEIARSYVANRAAARLGAQLALLSSLLLLCFISYIYARLRRAEGGPRWPSALVLLGGGVLVTASVIEAGFAYAASEIGIAETETQAAKFISLWTWNSAALLAPGSAAVLLGSTVNGFVYGGIPRGLAAFGLVIVVLSLVIGVILGTPGLAAMLSSLWILAAALILSWEEVRGRRLTDQEEA